MTIENALDIYLKADSSLSTSIGGRIYWMQAVQTTITPYLVYQVISDTDEIFSFGNTNTGNALIQFDIVGSTKAHKSIMFRVRDLIRGYAGIMGGTGGVEIYASFPSNLRDTFNPDTNKYIFSCDYQIQFKY